jgi:hypothetical protein
VGWFDPATDTNPTTDKRKENKSILDFTVIVEYFYGKLPSGLFLQEKVEIPAIQRER